MFIDRTKKNGAVASSQARLSSRFSLKPSYVMALVSVVACARGKKMFATTCAPIGSLSKGKNVPLRMNIGVMNRKAG